MWSFLLIGLLAATVLVLVGTNLRQRRSIEALKRAREELQVEEDRVFDFLHGLGEAFSDNLRSSDLHRLIVGGATRITDAHGGALYLVDRTGKLLVPSFISKDCPPLVEVPPLNQVRGTLMFEFPYAVDVIDYPDSGKMGVAAGVKNGDLSTAGHFR